MEALADILDTTGLFYYMTMKEFERKELAQQKIRPHVVRKIKMTEKERLVQNRNMNWQEIFDFRNLLEYVEPDMQIESYEELFLYISQLPINVCFLRHIPQTELFPCQIITGNIAWINQNRSGHFRYYSKNKRKEVVSFDLIDMVEIAYGISTMEAVERIVEVLSIRFMESLWLKKQKEKYLRNYQFIAYQIEQNGRFPTLKDYLRGYMSLLEAMNAIGTLHIQNKSIAHKGHNVFFASTHHIAEFLGQYTQSKVVKLINLFAALGLIEKVSTDYLPIQYIEESNRILDLRGLGNIVSYYIVHDFEQVAQAAEERACLLKKYGIRYSNISKSILRKAMGQSVADEVFVQTIQTNKKKEDKRLEVVQHKLELNFLNLLRTKPCVTKSMVLDLPVHALTKKQKTHHLNQIWTFLIEKYECQYIKPSKVMQKELGLLNLEYIAIPTNRSIL